MSKLLSVLLLFTGYTLVYAAVAEHGYFATDPWLGVIGDAYDTYKANGGAAASPGDVVPSQNASGPSGTGPVAPSPQSVGATVRSRIATRAADNNKITALERKVASQVKAMGHGYTTRIVRGHQQLLFQGKVIKTG